LVDKPDAAHDRQQSCGSARVALAFTKAKLRACEQVRCFIRNPNLVIAMATVAYVLVSICQWWAISSSNRLTQQYISTSDGAYFIFSAEHVGYTPKTVRIVFRNEGKVPAKAFRGEMEVGYIQPPSQNFIPTNNYTLGGSNEIVGQFPYYEWIEMDLPAFTNEPDPPYKMAILEVVRANISYDNGFGDRKMQEFCQYYWNGNWIDCASLSGLLKNQKRK
jgi:hypothetical protein